MNNNGSVLILGAGSDVGRAIAREYTRKGRAIILAARNCGRLQADANDLTQRHQVPVHTVEFDVLNTAAHSAFLDSLKEFPMTVVCVVGLLGDQEQAQKDFPAADVIIRSNYTGVVGILGEVANRMEALGRGCIIGISSVAGDRGRATNYIYGSAKAGLTAFLSGLRQRLSRKNVRVITVKPGFIRTKMTAHMPLPEALTAQPVEVAQAVVNAEYEGGDIIYVRWIWRYIMLTISHMPEFLFKRMQF